MRCGWKVRVDTAFAEVARACGGGRGGMWLTQPLAAAYDALHAEGIAHSAGAWDGDRLAGGLFGVWTRRFRTAESMFHSASDGGNAALAALLGVAVDIGAEVIDVQMMSPHVERSGARGVPYDDLPVMLTQAPRA